MPADSWKLAPGLNNVGSYQVSGKPFASGSIDCTSATVVRFPSVTRWVVIHNRSAVADEDLKVGFSEAGVRADAVRVRIMVLIFLKELNQCKQSENNKVVRI